MAKSPAVAVLIPCFNEEVAIAAVVSGFKGAIPTASIYVYDNNSTDETAERARAAGAIVRHEPRQGKGNVIRRMFADIESDIYIMVDGDATYDADSAPMIVRKMVTDNLDLVNCVRVGRDEVTGRFGHGIGNKIFTGIVRWFFGSNLNDILSGYKGLSRRFVKSFPVLSQGFEIETEIAVHALEQRMPVAELETKYSKRPVGSTSKLSTFRDGFKILRAIMHLVREERPLLFFSSLATALAVASLALGLPVIAEFRDTGLVPRLPTALLASSLMLAGVLLFVTGLILDTITLGRREAKRLKYLAIPALQSENQSLDHLV